MALVIFIFICIFIKEVQTYWYFGRRDSTRVGVESGGWQLQSGEEEEEEEEKKEEEEEKKEEEEKVEVGKEEKVEAK